MKEIEFLNISKKIVIAFVIVLISFLQKPVYAEEQETGVIDNEILSNTSEETGVFNIDILSNTSEEAELLLNYNNIQDINEIDFEIGYSEGLKELTFTELEDICNTTKGDSLVVNCDLSKYLSKSKINLGVIKYSWDSNLAQDISITTESDDLIKNYTYFQIVPVSNSTTLFSEFTVSQALKWLALVIAIALIIVVYILSTSYAEEIRSQQYVLFCITLVVVWALSSILIFSFNKNEEKTKLVMGVSTRKEFLKEDNIDTTEKLLFDEESLIRDYGDFLSDYIFYYSSGVCNKKSDFNNDGIIDMLDYVEIYNVISTESN